MKDLNSPSLGHSSLSASSSAVETNAHDLATKLDSLDTTIQRARDAACLFAYLTQDSLDSPSKHIELDRQALRGVMERIWGDLDEALVSLDTAKNLFSQIAKKSNF